VSVINITKWGSSEQKKTDQTLIKREVQPTTAHEGPEGGAEV
jgi:hypothetical protein